jgi:site-specific DNA-cytosine methylase
MLNCTSGRSPELGMRLVEWFVSFARRARPTSWSFENVRAAPIRELMQRNGLRHGNFDLSRYGVPQTRTRCLAGSAWLLRRFERDPSLRVDRPRSPADVLEVPEGATLVRASGGKCVECFYRSVHVPTWALLTSCKPVFVSEARECVRVMTVRELLLLQTFPEDYRMEHDGHLGSLGSEGDRIRLVGNAVPPEAARKLMLPLARRRARAA